MLATYSGHGKHGLRLADLAASVSFRHIRRRIPALSAFLTSTPNSFHRDVKAQVTMERLVAAALAVTYVTVHNTVWSRSSGVSITIALLRRGKLVVGACGLPSVMLVSRHNGTPVVKLLTAHAMHPHDPLDSDLSSACKSSSGSDDSLQPDPLAHFSPDLDARFSFPGDDSAGGDASGVRLSDAAAGTCVVPTIRSFDVSPRHTYVVVSTMRLWPGRATHAPNHIANVFASASPATCVIDLAEALMKAAFGRSGPTHDCSILCARLR